MCSYFDCAQCNKSHLYSPNTRILGDFHSIKGIQNSSTFKVSSSSFNLHGLGLLVEPFP